MLDWSGNLVKQLNCLPKTVNVFAVATNGAVLWNFHGVAETNKLAELVRLTEAHLGESASPNFNEARTARKQPAMPEPRRPARGTR